MPRPNGRLDPTINIYDLLNRPDNTQQSTKMRACIHTYLRIVRKYAEPGSSLGRSRGKNERSITIQGLCGRYPGQIHGNDTPYEDGLSVSSSVIERDRSGGGQW